MYNVPPSHVPDKYATFPSRTLHAFAKSGTLMGMICGLLFGLFGSLAGAVIGLLLGGSVGILCSYAYIIAIWRFIPPEQVTPAFLGKLYSLCTVIGLGVCLLGFCYSLKISPFHSLSILGWIVIAIASGIAWRIARSLVLTEI